MNERGPITIPCTTPLVRKAIVESDVPTQILLRSILQETIRSNLEAVLKCYPSKKAQVVRSHTATWWPTTHNTEGGNWRRERKMTQEATDDRRHRGKGELRHHDENSTRTTQDGSWGDSNRSMKHVKNLLVNSRLLQDTDTVFGHRTAIVTGESVTCMDTIRNVVLVFVMSHRIYYFSQR